MLSLSLNFQLALQHSQSIRKRGMGCMAHLFISQSESLAQRSLSAATPALRLHTCDHDDRLLPFSRTRTGSTIKTEIFF